MSRNVEIKAKIQNIAKLIEYSKEITNSEGDILHQQDTFFKVPEGRFKLRQFKDNQPAQLIYYNRPDTKGPKLSSYSLTTVPNPEELKSVLSQALGVKGTVEKTRTLFLYKQTRIHIDQVTNLGDFLELEVVLQPEQSTEDGQKIAEELMQKLKINSEDLLSGAYLDQLSN